MNQQIPIREQSLNETKGAFLLAGEMQGNKQLQRKEFDANVYMQSQSGLYALYSGFPTISSKTDAITLVKFPVQYLPVKNDLVIGIIKIRSAQSYVVDIGAPLDAILGGLQFDAATKRNKPNLKVGALVFCRVTEYSKHIGGKVSCMNKGVTIKKNNNELGQLKEGYSFWISPYKHQQIQANLLQRIGKCTKFEAAFGKNGRIWINSTKIENTMLIFNMFKLESIGLQQDKINALIAMLK